MVSAVALISILSVFSVTQYNRQRTKSLTKEAQLQLGHLNRMQAAYHMENNTFTFELSGNMFPKGTLLYNVGFGKSAEDLKTSPCGRITIGHDRSVTNNYYELCGNDLNTAGTRPECGFRSKKGAIPKLTLAYLELRSMHYYKSNHNCSNNNRPKWSDVSSLCRLTLPGPLTHAERNKIREERALEYIQDKNKSYRKYIAYAVGDILDPQNFSTLDHNKLDVWRINGNGFLEHCNDPLDNTTSNTCQTPAMGKTKDDPSLYCD